MRRRRRRRRRREGRARGQKDIWLRRERWTLFTHLSVGGHSLYRRGNFSYVFIVKLRARNDECLHYFVMGS